MHFIRFANNFNHTLTLEKRKAPSFANTDCTIRYGNERLANTLDYYSNAHAAVRKLASMSAFVDRIMTNPVVNREPYHIGMGGYCSGRLTDYFTAYQHALRLIVTIGFTNHVLFNRKDRIYRHGFGEV